MKEYTEVVEFLIIEIISSGGLKGWMNRDALNGTMGDSRIVEFGQVLAPRPKAFAY